MPVQRCKLKNKKDGNLESLENVILDLEQKRKLLNKEKL